jgi:hypothetical protein
MRPVVLALEVGEELIQAIFPMVVVPEIAAYQVPG